MSTENDTNYALNQLIKTLDKFDDSLTEHKKFCQKVGDVTSTMDKLIAVHEERLGEHERHMLELRNMMDTVKSEISVAFKEISVENKKSHMELASRISHLEKWRWFVVGAATCIGVLVHFIITLYKHIDELSTLSRMGG